jgi:hypothetical protein
MGRGDMLMMSAGDMFPFDRSLAKMMATMSVGMDPVT